MTSPAHLWHTEQLVNWPVFTSYFSTSFLPSSSWLDGGVQCMLKTWSRGRRNCSGARWQSRHQAICSDACCHINGIRSTSPWDQICEWQVMQVLVGGSPAKWESSTEVWQ